MVEKFYSSFQVYTFVLIYSEKDSCKVSSWQLTFESIFILLLAQHSFFSQNFEDISVF